jgi:hypothetical protein
MPLDDHRYKVDLSLYARIGEAEGRDLDIVPGDQEMQLHVYRLTDRNRALVAKKLYHAGCIRVCLGDHSFTGLELHISTFRRIRLRCPIPPTFAICDSRASGWKVVPRGHE